MSALDVLRQIKQARRQQTGVTKIVEWGNADYINSIGGIENLTRKDLRNHLEVFFKKLRYICYKLLYIL